MYHNFRYTCELSPAPAADMPHDTFHAVYGTYLSGSTKFYSFWGFVFVPEALLYLKYVAILLFRDSQCQHPSHPCACW